MARKGDGFVPDGELSEIMNKLWDLDTNKCFPGEDYDIDFQGFVTSTRNTSRDFARDSLFKWVNEEKVFARPTYRAFRALLDNYELEYGKEEVVTREEVKENWDFLDAIMETDVIKEAHSILSSRNLVPRDEEGFKKALYDIWFRLHRRKGTLDSCSFEHVFVGEGHGSELKGLHNWIQFYLQEKAGNINYHGYFRRETVQDDEFPRLIALQFSWRGEKAKPMCSCFLGTSPEFEIAVYTVALLMDRDGRVEAQIGEYEVELVVHSYSHGKFKKLSTAYIGAARM